MSEHRRIYYREDMEYNHCRLTIEEQLHMYEKFPDGNERASTLWHAWHQNKQWLIRLLELTLASFPSYSRHDVSHADAVLHNIERVLGEDRITLLSATDCFAILHTVYVHDIGMAILAEDREKIIKSDEFVEMIDDLVEGADKDLKKAALLLRQNCYRQIPEGEIDYDGQEYHEDMKKIYTKKLDTYYAVVQLLAEYQRGHHGEKAKSSVKAWILDKDKLRSEFAMSGVPMRIFFRIADCAALHTDWDFNHILELPWEENGYDNDMLHPRFVAVLLQLGDVLDIDNDRFHPFAHAFAGKFPEQSETHYNKHLAIRTLKITPEEIVIEADCENRDVMRQIRTECDGIEYLLKFASYHWSSIAPKGFSGALPSFKLAKLLLNGKAIPWDLAICRFRISQQKAFEFLQGRNIYPGCFPFVRELLQNAIDSSKLQCYDDYKSSAQYRFKGNHGDWGRLKIKQFSESVNQADYPIEITISCCRMDRSGDYEKVSFNEIPDTESESEKYGILFSIKDYGTGINTDTIRKISDVGTSYKGKKKLLREMPDWLRPTGEFGIGLQSVFLVNDVFCCETYARTGERYKIEFQTAANGRNGYINVEPVDPAQKPMEYGTEFQVFVSHDKKMNRQDCMSSWVEQDPFAQGHLNNQVKRDIATLAVQLIVDIDDQLEELLFPVLVSVDFDMGYTQQEFLKAKLSKVILDNLGGGSFTANNLKKHICWLCHDVDIESGDGNTIRIDMIQGVCQIDLAKMKMHLWMEDLSVSACLSIDSWLDSTLQSNKIPCMMYYKGILIDKTHHFDIAGNCLEYINIQGGRNGRKMIQLSRSGFTSEGLDYINSVIVPRIYKDLFEALRILANQIFYSAEDDRKLTFAEKIDKNIVKSLQEALQDGGGTLAQNWRRQLVGVSLYYNFYMREIEKREHLYLSRQEEFETEQWERAIFSVSKATKHVRGYRKKGEKVSILDVHAYSRLRAERVYADLQTNEFVLMGKTEITIADFYNRRNKFAVVSARRGTKDKWINNLILLQSIDGEERQELPLISLLEKSPIERNRQEKWAETMEQWANFMLTNIYDSLELQKERWSDVQAIEESDLLFMLLQTVSISACFKEETGNMKIHILSGKPLSCVYYNMFAKYDLLRRMAGQTERNNVRRFAGNVWMGYEALQVPVIPEGVCSIKEFYMKKEDTYMIFPCTGLEAQMLIIYGEKTEEMNWFDYPETGEKTEDQFKNVKDILVHIAELLYSCIFIEYSSIKDMYKNIFMEKYVVYCKEKKELISEVDFWDLIESRYIIELRTIVHMQTQRTEDRKRTEVWEESSMSDSIIEKLMKQAEQLLCDVDRIEELRNTIIMGIFDNMERLVLETDLLKEEDLWRAMEELTEYCITFETLWSQMEYLKRDLKQKEIKRILFTNSVESQNMVSWLSEHTNYAEDILRQFYDRMREEFVRVVIKQTDIRMGNRNPELLNWMRG